MKRTSATAFTLIDLAVTLLVCGLLLSLAIPFVMRERQRSQRITCTNYLMQIGFSLKTWALDHNNLYPTQVSVTNGGSLEFVNSGQAFRHFQVMSNELSTPKVLACPGDARKPAKSFTALANSNLSYFLNVDADDRNPDSVQAGDRNITNGTSPVNGLLILQSNQPAGWTPAIHHGLCQVLLEDGSVQQAPSTGFAGVLDSSTSNRLAIP